MADPRNDLVALTERLLDVHGHSCPRHELAHALEADGSLEGVASELTLRGIPARVVQLSKATLPALALPTLVRMADGTVALAWRRRRGEWLVETRPGVRRAVSPDEIAQPRGAALEVSSGGPQSEGIVARLVHVLHEHRHLLARLALLSGLLQLLGLAAPMGTQLAIDVALPDGSRSLLFLLALALVASAVHRALMEFLREAVTRQLEARLLSATLQGVFSHLMQLPLPWLKRKTISELMQVLVSAESLVQVSVTSLVVPAIDALAAVAYLVLVFARMPGLGLCLMGVTAALVVVTAWCARQYSRMQQTSVTASARQRALMYELLQGAPTLRAASAQTPAIARWIHALGQSQTINVRGLRVGLWLEVLFEGSVQLVTVAVLIWGGGKCLQGTLSPGTLVATVMLSQAFMLSVQALSMAALPIFGGLADVRRVDEALATPKVPRSSRGHSDQGDVVMEDVWFRYSPTTPWILQGVSLRVPAGGRHQISGPSGSGKTTILRLLAGLQAPDRGRISIGASPPGSGTDGGVAYLPQEPYLLEGSILDNLLVMSQAPRQRILDVAEATGLADVVDKLPMRYDTRLPPGGGTLSGGERQLLLITACLASDCQVLLLDEAFASIDRLTRERIGNSGLLSQRTVISVEHGTS